MKIFTMASSLTFVLIPLRNFAMVDRGTPLSFIIQDNFTPWFIRNLMIFLRASGPSRDTSFLILSSFNVITKEKIIKCWINISQLLQRLTAPDILLWFSWIQQRVSVTKSSIFLDEMRNYDLYGSFEVRLGESKSSCPEMGFYFVIALF